MTIPAIVLGVVVSTIYSSAFHLWRGGGAGRYFTFLILGWIGFWLGHFIGAQFGLDFLIVGPLRLGMATIGSLVILLFGNWLTHIEPAKEQP